MTDGRVTEGSAIVAKALGVAVIASGVALVAAAPARVPVLGQIALPHNYYYRELYLPQLTSGPSSVAWSADGQTLVYSMQGSVWRQRVDSTVAEQLTDGGGDYQPHCSPDGRSVVFVRYDGRALELMLLDLTTREIHALTTGGAVNVEPRWSPDGNRIAFVSTVGTGHFLVHVAEVHGGRLERIAPLMPDRRSNVSRYYYSAFDHTINPAWTADGQSLVFITNREIAHGTGDIVRMAIAGSDTPQLVHHEETSWHARPDVSPDGTRIVYSSYLGRQWQQLWLLPVGGGYPFPLTYGDYDNTNPAWSPDGRKIAFISNRAGNTALWLVDAMSGEERSIDAGTRRYLQPHRELTLDIVDEAGRALPARISVTDSRQRTYAPDDAWIQADDMLVPERQTIETRYFHSTGRSQIAVPLDRLAITVSHGPAYEIARLDEDSRAAGWSGRRTITLRRLPAAPGSGEWWSGDLHVHMNYGGLYRNTSSHLAAQGRAEDLNVIENLVVNKEQRFPDMASFSPDLDAASDDRLLILHGQEFHTSYWGHLSILNLQHLLLPGYAAYPLTAAASPYPHNAAVADMAHAQRGLVGYAHPFDEDVDPRQAGPLTNALPIDAALGKIDYYEAVGFSDHKSSNAVWHRLLECGVELPIAAGTDAMANYASLRGPVGLNRVYVPADGALTREAFLTAIKKGRGVATNGPLIQFAVDSAAPGDTLDVSTPGRLRYRATLRANFPVDHLEVVWNGQVMASLAIGANRRAADVSGEIPVTKSGWILLRAWNDGPDPAVLDIYPYATTNPVYVRVAGKRRRSGTAATYFLQWLDRIQDATTGNASYRTSAERAAVLRDVAQARTFYEQCRREAGEAGE
jgi:Tol biopolymer transport system component